VADLPTRAQIFSAGRAYVKQQALINANVRITPAIVDVAGSDVNLLLGTGSVMGEQLTAAFAKCMQALFIGTARGAALDRVIYDRFQITRNPSNAATVDLVLQRPTDGAGGGVLAAGSRITTPGGNVFSLQTDITFGATDLIQPAEGFAAIVGPDQNVLAGTLTAWIDSPFDSTITVTNPGPAAGGTAGESDDQFKGRALAYFLSIRRGILAAIQVAATTLDPSNPSKSLLGVSIATAYEIVNPGNALPAGAVQLIIGDDNGNASQAMVQAVINNLLFFRSAGIPVFVSGGQVQFEQVIYDLEFAAGIDTVAASQQVAAVAVAITQFNQPGQNLLRSSLFSAARAVPGVIVPATAVVAPVGDVVPPNINTILRVRQQDISFM
jgi:hypothetical protein